MAAWFRRNRPDRHTAAHPMEADETTGPIPVIDIAAFAREKDDAASGTEAAGAASNSDVDPVTASAPRTPEDPTGTARSTTAELESALAERQALVRLCLYAFDRARSSGVAERIEHGLEEIGVCALRPDGERFDPSLHEAGGASPTGDPALEGTVAETEIVGFHDRRKLLRVPVVTVYTRGDEEAVG